MRFQNQLRGTDARSSAGAELSIPIARSMTYGSAADTTERTISGYSISTMGESYTGSRYFQSYYIGP
jgi:hypothetical protein